MSRRICFITLLVRDYDEAITYYTERLGFNLAEDTKLTEDKRWVSIKPHSGGTQILLARASNPEQAAQIGNQAGGRVFHFLETDHFHSDFTEMKARGVHFMEAPRSEDCGTVAVFEDLYGNRWDLIEFRDQGS